MARFRDRSDAGRRLAAHVRPWASFEPLVLGLARGGMPVAYEVARALGAPLDVLVVRKLGVPGHDELAMGAVGPGGTIILNDSVVRSLRIPTHVVEEITRREVDVIEHRQRVYHHAASAPASTSVSGRTIIVVDDGLATGASMRAAIACLRHAGAQRVIVAVPTGSADTCEELQAEADDVVCLTNPEPFLAVGLWYDDFTPTTDEDVRDLLARAADERQRSLREPAAHEGHRHA
jgi:predicted phosphoribosyltransferase